MTQANPLKKSRRKARWEEKRDKRNSKWKKLLGTALIIGLVLAASSLLSGCELMNLDPLTGQIQSVDEHMAEVEGRIATQEQHLADINEALTGDTGIRVRLN